MGDRYTSKEADWVEWTLHLIFGFVCGAAMLGGSAAKMDGSGQTILMLAISGGLIVGVFGSYYGDELWNPGAYRCIPPDEMHRSNETVWASRIIGVLGIGVLLWWYIPLVEF